jgi:hypothetical protein
MKKTWIALAAILVVLIVVRIGIGLTAKTDDRQQIRQALKDSIQTGKDGKPGGVLDLLGKNLTVNSDSANGSMGQLADFIKRTHPDVTFDTVDPIIKGDHAQVNSAATIDVGILGQHQTYHLPNVVLIFQKEAATRWFIFPTQKWKLEQVYAPNFSPDQLTN